MALVAALVVVVGFCAVWPPRWAPDGWRRLTRTVRHRVRRRYYRHSAPWDQVPPAETTEPGFDWDRGTRPDGS